MRYLNIDYSLRSLKRREVLSVATLLWQLFISLSYSNYSSFVLDSCFTMFADTYELFRVSATKKTRLIECSKRVTGCLVRRSVEILTARRSFGREGIFWCASLSSATNKSVILCSRLADNARRVLLFRSIQRISNSVSRGKQRCTPITSDRRDGSRSYLSLSLSFYSQAIRRL